MSQQQTIAKEVSASGIALHSGKTVNITLKPAEEYTGIIFHRTDVTPGSGAITVCVAGVQDAELCTKLSNDHGVTVATIEHVMAALYALNIDNIIIELDAEEMPVFDGSSLKFIELIDKAGIIKQQDKRQAIKVLKEVVVKEGNRAVSVKPSNHFSLHVFVDYGFAFPPNKDDFDGSEEEFRLRIANCRTFCLEKDVDYMQSIGLAKGGSLENAVVFGEQGVLNEEGLRTKNEPLNHKALDCLGDFYMSGYRILGAFNVTRPGHELNNKLLKAVLENKENWKWV